MKLGLALFAVLLSHLASVSLGQFMIWDFYQDSSCSHAGQSSPYWLWADPQFQPLGECGFFTNRNYGLKPLACANGKASWDGFVNGCDESGMNGIAPGVHTEVGIGACIKLSEESTGSTSQWAKVTCGMPSTKDLDTNSTATA